MDSVRYTIIPNINCPEYQVLQGWRRWLAAVKLYRRPRAVFTAEGGKLFCHPNTMDTLTRYLQANGHTYRVGLASVSRTAGPK